MQKIDINILGYKFNISCKDEEVMHIKKLESFINDKGSKVSTNLPFEKRAVLTLLAVADDMAKSYKTMDLQKQIVYKQKDMIEGQNEEIKTLSNKSANIESYLATILDKIKSSNDILENKSKI